MRLYEFEGKKLLKRYGISVPRGVLYTSPKSGVLQNFAPLVLKVQTLFGERKKKGWVLFAKTSRLAGRSLKDLWGRELEGKRTKKILVEEKIKAVREYYISLSYDTDTRSPVLALSTSGGSNIKKANLFPVDPVFGLPDFFLRQALFDSKFHSGDIRPLGGVLKKLWKLFMDEYALLAEINPLFKTKDGNFIAGDAKIILDDEKVRPGERRFIEMGGDIAVLASGGGASLINLDALLYYGGRPANYTEYSGNPPSEVVKNLTLRVLDRRGLKGCWVVGGTANFTDIFETMKGFVAGLREVSPRPNYPIVIRRDGPRQKEAFKMLREVAVKEGYDFHLFGSETPMSETARIITKLSYHK